MSDAINVPTFSGPRKTLCWIAPALDGSQGNPMRHCDRPKGHAGPHTWELFDQVRRACSCHEDLPDPFDPHCPVHGEPTRAGDARSPARETPDRREKQANPSRVDGE